MEVASSTRRPWRASQGYSRPRRCACRRRHSSGCWVPTGHDSGRQWEATDRSTRVEIARVGDSGKEGLTAALASQVREGRRLLLVVGDEHAGGGEGHASGRPVRPGAGSFAAVAACLHGLLKPSGRFWQMLAAGRGVHGAAGGGRMRIFPHGPDTLDDSGADGMRVDRDDSLDVATRRAGPAATCPLRALRALSARSAASGGPGVALLFRRPWSAWQGLSCQGATIRTPCTGFAT
jgi:hypothetical protein